MEEYLTTHHFALIGSGGRVPNLRIFEAEVTPLEKESLGRLLMLSELKSDNPNIDEILSFLEEEIKRNYYGTDLFDSERAFENALQKTNHQLQDLIEKSGSDWLEHLSCLVAVIYKDQLHLAHLGPIHAFLIHQQKIIDILASAGASAAVKINPLRVFSNILSGVVTPGDVVVFCNTAILDFLSLEKIRKMIVENKAEASARSLKALLEETGSPNNFGALFIHINTIPVTEQQPIPGQREVITTEERRKGQMPEASMGTLMHNEEETLNTLRPSLWHHVRNRVKALTSRRDNIADANVTLSRRLARSHQHRNVYKPLTIVQRAGSVLLDALKKTSHALSSIVAGLRKPSRKTFAGGPGNVGIALRRRTGSLKDRFLGMPRSRKALLVVSVLFVAFFAQSVLQSGESKEEELSKEEYAQILASAEENVLEAENVLIYENENDARGFLLQALEGLKSIPADNKDYRERVLGVQTKADELLQKVNHVTDANNAPVISDFSTSFPQVQLSSLALAGGNLYASHPSDQNVYRVTLKTKEISDVSTVAKTGMKFASAQNATVLYMQVDQSLLSLDTGNDETKPRAVTFSQDNRSVDAMEFFSGRLYTLDLGNSQMYKHNATNEGFGAGTPWFASATDIVNARDLAVDGSIYVLRSNGMIQKFFQGAIDTSFVSPTLSPETTDAIKIVTNDQMTNLYVLDRDQKRLLIINKTGQLLGQITSQQWTDLQDVAIDEPQKKAYILSGTIVYEVALP